MVQRTTGIIIALGGLALVFILLFFGFNVYLSARRGPKWKRKLLSAGIIALSLLGITLPMSSCTDSPQPSSVTGAGGKAGSKQVNDSVAGESGEKNSKSALESLPGNESSLLEDMPGKDKIVFSKPEQIEDVIQSARKLLEKEEKKDDEVLNMILMLYFASEATKELRDKKIISEEKAMILSVEIDKVSKALSKFSEKYQMCYAMQIVPAPKNPAHAKKRLPAVIRLANDGKISLEVSKKLIPVFEEEIKKLPAVDGGSRE
ncbi:MAG: hypothetical protein ACYS8W_17100 [Planctomycetota bacterium]|jgi:hypothetical protein